MYNNINLIHKKLPTDIINVIFGYYYSCISKELSNEIKNFKKLLLIKQKCYCSQNGKLWFLDKIITSLQNNPFYTINKSTIINKKFKGFIIWKNKFKMINIIWNLYTIQEQNEIFIKEFPNLLPFINEDIDYFIPFHHYNFLLIQ